MSAKIFGKVWELQIDPIEKLVLLALADHADHEGNNVRPGNKLLCAKTGLSERTIGLKIADFLERGILLPVQTTTGRGNIREFAIDVDAIPRSQYFINREKLKIEAGSTFTHRQRSKPDQPLSRPQRLRKVEDGALKVEVEGSPYKEGTVMNLIGDVDTPHTPSQSFVGESTHSLLAMTELCECGDRKFEHVNGDGACNLNGLGHGILASEPENRCNSFRPTGYSDATGIETVRDGVSDAPTPLSPLAPPAQAAVIAPAQNAQLRVLSPVSDLTGITASIEAVDQPSTPVSAKSNKGFRKAKTEKTDSPEEIQRKADHVTLMDALRTRTGQPILNGGAQAGAIKRILGGYTVEQAIEVLDSQLAGNWRGPVSWLSVQTQIADYFRRKEQQSQTKLGGNNGKSKFDFFDICNSQPFASY